MNWKLFLNLMVLKSGCTLLSFIEAKRQATSPKMKVELWGPLRYVYKIIIFA